MGDLPKYDFSARDLHMSMLQTVLGRKRASASLLHSFTRSFNGFVARLTDNEMNQISSLEGVVSVFPSTKKQLHTTRSWDFMGFPIGAQRSKIETDVVVGLLDTGVWPESESFRDEGLGAPPTKWKGSCQSDSNFTCNNKIIGARYYHVQGKIESPDIPSPRDTNGHGTHTASTAAGGIVSDANLYGLGKGTARGGVVSGRIAVYKVCWVLYCSDADILAAFDDAIADGVDIISVSLGGLFPADNYFSDSISIGAFHAMKHGILTSNSAGNSGPKAGSIVNVSPWSLSVAANTIDRKFMSKVCLGSNSVFEGVAINTYTMVNSYPLVYGGDVPDVAAGFNSSTSRYCEPNSLDAKLVEGNIILCEGTDNLDVAANAGAIGIIVQDNGFRDYGNSFSISASYLGSHDGAEVLDYINKTSEPKAKIFKSDEVNETAAPFVVSFSSRGPNRITSDILKPDLTAPGVDILAAWSEATTVTGLPLDNRVVPYNIISGTSMSCPHASGAAAYVKSFNPRWSPAAIKSALMTTASEMSASRNVDAEFAYGSGQIDPVKAISPGLIYDIAESDYVKFLCGQGYSNKNLDLITGDNSTCSLGQNSYDLNYPSFSISAPEETFVSRIFHREVTHVGSSSSTYRAVVVSPSQLKIEVVPASLSFISSGEKKRFTVTVSGKVSKRVVSAALVWEDGYSRVRSPIVAHAV